MVVEAEFAHPTMTLLVNAALVVLALMVLRLGIWATVLTVALVVLLLCHPMLHTFLELAVPNHLVSDQSAARDEAHASALRRRLSDLATRPKGSAKAQGRMDLSGVPAELRTELGQILQLVKRDFIQYWYDPISFGDDAFPDEAIGSLEHLFSQVSLRLEQFRRANVATELSLTALSVLVAALRRRRIAQSNAATDAGGTSKALGLGLWETSEARIESLRASISTLLLQSLPYEDSRSPALITLLTEILTKQIWETLQTQSDPDVLNQYIVQYGKKSPGTAITAMALGDVPSQVEAAAQRSANSVLHAAPDVASSVTSTLGSAVAVSAPAVAGAAEQTAGVLHEAYSTLAGAAVGDEAGQPDQPSGTDLQKAGEAPAMDQAKEPKATDGATADRAKEAKARASGATDKAANAADAQAAGAKAQHMPPSKDVRKDSQAATSEAPHLAKPSDTRAEQRAAPSAADKSTTGDLLSLDDDTNPWADPPKASPLARGPHQGALVNADLLDLTNDLDTQPPARPMDIPKELREPPLPRSLQQSTYDAPLGYEVRRSHSPRASGITEVLASRDPEKLDPFEHYLQEVDASHSAQKRRPEGATLMQLHANLDALARTADHHSMTPELFEADVRNILRPALDLLPEHETPPALPSARVRPAIRQALAGSLATPSAVRPVQHALLARLQQLWDAYMAQSASRHLAYEPRRPPSRPTSGAGVARGRSPELQRTLASTEGITTVSVVDVSANAERAGPIDVRSLQVLISIEDTSSHAGGYVLLRSWAQFEALHAELERLYAQRPVDTVLGAPPPGLPALRGKSSGEACEALQTYLTRLLVSKDGNIAWYSTTQAVQRFIDKTRAEEEPVRNRANLMSSIGDVGRSFASGVAGAAGTARKGLGQGIGQIGSVAPAAATAPARLGTNFSRGLFGAKDARSPTSPRPTSRSPFDERVPFDTGAELPRPPLPARARNSQPFEREALGDVAAESGPGAGEAKRGADMARADERRSVDAPRSADAPHSADAPRSADARPPTDARPPANTRRPTDTRPPAEGRAPQASDAASGRAEPRAKDAPGDTAKEVPAPPAPPKDPVPRSSSPRKPRAVPAKHAGDAGKPAGKPGKPGAAPAPNAQDEAENLSPQDIDALLTAVFAVVHEAFNLQGAWTLRRGLLRVLEQVVRTTYSTSVVSTLVYFASMLTVPALASWLEVLRATLWPNGVWKSESAPPRTVAQKRATAAEAREVVLSYTPTQAAYTIGMGGKQTCMDALATIHEVVTDPVVALDLHLALVLRVLDLAMGTASGDRGL